MTSIFKTDVWVARVCLIAFVLTLLRFVQGTFEAKLILGILACAGILSLYDKYREARDYQA
jgi:hypothetical protein